MSIYKIKNVTELSVTISWLNDFVFEKGVIVDLMNDLNLSLDEFLGREGGSLYDGFKDLILSGNFKMNDSEMDLSTHCGLELLKFGTISYPVKKSGTNFESHNLMDENEWLSPSDSSFSVAPKAGKKLLLTGSKVLISSDAVPDDALYFNVYVGNYLAATTEYPDFGKLMLGADKVYKSESIGNPASGGCPALSHIVYNYDEVIELKSSMGMRIEIGFKNHKPPLSKNSILKIRINAKSIDE